MTDYDYDDEYRHQASREVVRIHVQLKKAREELRARVDEIRELREQLNLSERKGVDLQQQLWATKAENTQLSVTIDNLTEDFKALERDVREQVRANETHTRETKRITDRIHGLNSDKDQQIQSLTRQLAQQRDETELHARNAAALRNELESMSHALQLREAECSRLAMCGADLQRARAKDAALLQQLEEEKVARAAAESEAERARTHAEHADGLRRELERRCIDQTDHIDVLSKQVAQACDEVQRQEEKSLGCTMEREMALQRREEELLRREAALAHDQLELERQVRMIEETEMNRSASNRRRSLEMELDARENERAELSRHAAAARRDVMDAEVATTEELTNASIRIEELQNDKRQLLKIIAMFPEGRKFVDEIGDISELTYVQYKTLEDEIRKCRCDGLDKSRGLRGGPSLVATVALRQKQDSFEAARKRQAQLEEELGQWHPSAAVAKTQKLAQAYGLGVAPSTFGKLLNDLNRIWRARHVRQRDRYVRSLDDVRRQISQSIPASDVLQQVSRRATRGTNQFELPTSDHSLLAPVYQPRTIDEVSAAANVGRSPARVLSNSRGRRQPKTPEQQRDDTEAEFVNGSVWMSQSCIAAVDTLQDSVRHEALLCRADLRELALDNTTPVSDVVLLFDAFTKHTELEVDKCRNALLRVTNSALNTLEK